MERLPALADLSIRRACGFAGFAILLSVTTLLFEPLLALRVGGAGSALLVLALLVAAWRAPRRDIRDTEVYGMLRPHVSPPSALAQPAARARIASVLRARLMWHAERLAVLPFLFWLPAGGLWLLG